jgi:hypothetical protein
MRAEVKMQEGKAGGGMTFWDSRASTWPRNIKVHVIIGKPRHWNWKRELGRDKSQHPQSSSGQWRGSNGAPMRFLRPFTLHRHSPATSLKSSPSRAMRACNGALTSRTSTSAYDLAFPSLSAPVSRGLELRTSKRSRTMSGSRVSNTRAWPAMAGTLTTLALEACRRSTTRAMALISRRASSPSATVLGRPGSRGLPGKTQSSWLALRTASTRSRPPCGSTLV